MTSHYGLETKVVEMGSSLKAINNDDISTEGLKAWMDVQREKRKAYKKHYFGEQESTLPSNRIKSAEVDGAAKSISQEIAEISVRLDQLIKERGLK